jgi:hypothetical protein
VEPGRGPGVCAGAADLCGDGFYHKKLPTQPAALEPFLAEVEQYALGDYMRRCCRGQRAAGGAKQAVAEKLHGYTGLPVACC